MHPVASENRYGTGWREAPHKQACEGGPIIDIHRRLLIKNNRLIFIIIVLYLACPQFYAMA